MNLQNDKEGSGHTKAAVIAGVFAIIAACITGLFLILNTMVDNGIIVLEATTQPTQAVLPLPTNTIQPVVRFTDAPIIQLQPTQRIISTPVLQPQTINGFPVIQVGPYWGWNERFNAMTLMLNIVWAGDCLDNVDVIVDDEAFSAGMITDTNSLLYSNQKIPFEGTTGTTCNYLISATKALRPSRYFSVPSTTYCVIHAKNSGFVIGNDPTI